MQKNRLFAQGACVKLIYVFFPSLFWSQVVNLFDKTSGRLCDGSKAQRLASESLSDRWLPRMFTSTWTTARPDSAQPLPAQRGSSWGSHWQCYNVLPGEAIQDVQAAKHALPPQHGAAFNLTPSPSALSHERDGKLIVCDRQHCGTNHLPLPSLHKTVRPAASTPRKWLEWKGPGSAQRMSSSRHH